MFDAATADLTGMAPASAMLEVAKGYHKAFVAVDEEGTEAAAATATATRTGAGRGTRRRSSSRRTTRSCSTGAILFVGRLV